MRGNPVRPFAAVAAAGAAALVLYAYRRCRRLASQPMVVAEIPCEVEGRPWYQLVVVTEVAACGVRLRGLHLGSAANPPESLVKMVCEGSEWTPVAGALLKDYAAFALLPFALLPDRGFVPKSRACLIGLAGGSLLHAWLFCVRGGDTLCVDAVEIDGAVLRAAREHLGLGCCERTGRVALHKGDGAAFLAAAEDESYHLLMVDLDMGSLLNRDDARPARQLYRVLEERGVCVVNEYSEEPAHQRLEGVLRSVRALRQYFAEVHVLRTTPHNVMFIATVERVALEGPGTPLERLCSAADRLGFVGGLELGLGTRLRQLPPNRYCVY